MIRQRLMTSFTVAGSLCLGLLCSSSASAQQSERQSSDKSGQQSAGPAEIPEFLKELDLSSDQQSQIKESLQNYNQKLFQTWKQFHKKHIQAVNLEAAWASAVRDTLSEEDQRKFDQQRLQDREMTRHSQGDFSQQGDSPADRRRETRERRRQEAAEAAEDRQADRRERRQGKSERRQARSDSPDTRGELQAREGELDFVVITIRSPERFIQGMNQSSQQKQQCSEACRKYKQELTSLWRELHQLHYELVGIEADRIQAVEEQLTDEQLTQLREDRQQPQTEETSATSGSQRTR